MKINRRFLTLTLALIALGLSGFALLLRTTSFSVPSPLPSSAIPPTPDPAASPTSIQPIATPEWAVFPNYVPATPYAVEALYQPFERGFMVWRSDENCAYALLYTEGFTNVATAVIPAEIPGDMIHSYGYCLTVAPLTERITSMTPPAGLMLPTNALGIVWNYYAEVGIRLGYATQPASHYRATVTDTNNSTVMDGQPFTFPQVTLPDGHLLACGSRAATAKKCIY